MKVLVIKFLSLIFTLVIMLMVLAACESDLPERCPDLQFTLNVNSDSTEYSITADLDGIEDLIYGWYVNDTLVETEGLDEDRDHIFNLDFPPGTYTVCVIAQSTECGGEVEFCEDITIRGRTDEDCPELEFSTDRQSDHKYLFTAHFEGMERLEYIWYVDGDSIESEPIDGERHHKFDYVFRPGTHLVCIKARTEECGELEFCKEIVIEEGECPEPEFTVERDGDFAYFFTAIFEGKEHTQYKWYIDGTFVDKENFEGHDTNHNLYWQFGPGTYSICVETVATDACEAKEYCKEITLEGTATGCPDLYFGYDHQGDNQYKFIADFEGRDTLTYYAWYVDGGLVEEENAEGDDYLIWNFEPGVYEVCIKTETEECPEGAHYCKEILVENRECIDVSYTAEEVEGGYKFTADFEQRDYTTYIWKVFINDEFQGEEIRYAGSDDDHEFFWTFESGVVYEVCLKQDDCQDAIVCQEFSID